MYRVRIRITCIGLGLGLVSCRKMRFFCRKTCSLTFACKFSCAPSTHTSQQMKAWSIVI